MKHCNYKYSRNAEHKIYTRVVRSALFLSDEERAVLLFILDRTIGWHKVWETISASQFVDGVIKLRGKRVITVASGTRLTLDQVSEALVRLRECGAIETEERGHKIDYKINVDWCPSDLLELRMWELNEDDYEYEEDTGSC